ncbi:MAG: hypothetical protein GYB36_08280 [Alphaproteobacteria bacterium]|nr:hypothetical protein [Alphaproteobacteria bacterium]
MKHDLRIDVDAGLVVSRITGKLTAQSARQVYLECLTHPDWTPRLDHLLVYERIDLSDLTTDEVQKMVLAFKALDDQYREGISSKAATVMDSYLQNGILQYYEAVSVPELITEERIFETEAEARAWLAE